MCIGEIGYKRLRRKLCVQIWSKICVPAWFGTFGMIPLDALNVWFSITTGCAEQMSDWTYLCKKVIADFLQIFSGQQKSWTSWNRTSIWFYFLYVLTSILLSCAQFFAQNHDVWDIMKWVVRVCWSNENSIFLNGARYYAQVYVEYVLFLHILWRYTNINS